MVAESESAEALAHAAEQLAALPVDALTAMGSKARGFYREQLALAEGVRQFGEIFTRVATTV